MIPDTLAYMIAGYLVILFGISGYIFSLITRSAKIRRNSIRSSEKKVSEDID